MASWQSPRPASFKDSSPISPISPASPASLPQWLRHTRPRTALLSNSRIKLLAMCLICMTLGWVMTSYLAPDDLDSLYNEAVTAEGDRVAASAAVPLGNGQPGFILENTTQSGVQLSKSPSVSDALADLHHAVAGKLQTWNPYRPKDPTTTNHTSSPPQKNATGFSTMEVVTPAESAEDSLGARVRIGKCTILFNGNSYWERAIRSHERHNREHGYRLHVLRQDLLDDVWSKPAYILSLLLRELAKPSGERLEWLFWVDADTIILNPHIPIDVFLPPPGTEFDEIHLMFSKDWNGLNNGVFPVRVNKWSAELFSAIVAYRHFRPQDPLTFRDQSAMDTLLQEPHFAKSVIEAPQRWFNAYQGEHNETLAPYQIRRGDFLVHFAGVAAREERMGYWLERAEQHTDDWEIPLKSTSYPVETREFWADQRRARADARTALAAARLAAKQLLDQTAARLGDYSDRLEPTVPASITAQQEALKAVLNNEDSSALLKNITDATDALATAAAPLTTAYADALKALLSAAHEAIYGGERDVLEGKSIVDATGGAHAAELNRVADSVQKLKGSIMSPPDTWDRAVLIIETNAVTEARAAWLAIKMSYIPAQQAPAQQPAADLNPVQAVQSVTQVQALDLSASSEVAATSTATIDDAAAEQMAAIAAIITALAAANPGPDDAAATTAVAGGAAAEAAAKALASP